jgi:hypothetical protein
VAVERAKSLHRFALEQGALLSTFVVTIRPAEAVELMDWYAAQYEGTNLIFDADLAYARATNDPWKLLDNFTLFGMAIGRTEELN